MKRTATGLLLVSLAFGAVACGDDDGGSGSGGTIVRPTSGEEAELAGTAEAYFAAFVSGDGVATRAFLSARCDEELPDPDFADFVAAVPQQYPDLRITAWRVVEVDGDEGEVEYDTGVAAIDAEGPKRWVREDGAWKYDGC